CAWIAAQEPVDVLRYGQFKQKLLKGEVRSARVGPTEVTGELSSTRLDGRPVKFRASRLGIERDEDLAGLLESHVPDGNYDAAPDHSTAQSVMMSLMLVTFAGLLLWAISKNAGGLGSAVAFVRSRHKLYDNGEGRVT